MYFYKPLVITIIYKLVFLLYYEKMLLQNFLKFLIFFNKFNRHHSLIDMINHLCHKIFYLHVINTKFQQKMIKLQKLKKLFLSLDMHFHNIYFKILLAYYGLLLLVHIIHCTINLFLLFKLVFLVYI